MAKKKPYKQPIQQKEVSPKVWIKEHAMPTAVQRIKQDIGRWRLAAKEAESITNPQRYIMQQLYLDTILNGQVTSAMERRFMNVQKKGLQVVDENENINEELTKLYNRPWMHRIVRYTLEAQMYGYSLIQLGDMVNYEFKDLYTIRRANVNPEREVVTNTFYELNGISINDPIYSDFLIYVRTPQEIGMACDWGRCGYGLLYKVAPYEIWYKQAMTLWNEYQQLFGMPIRIGKTDTTNEQMRNQMADMLANMGAAAWGVFNTDDTIELVDSGNMTGGNEVYLTMVDKVEKIISKILLGHADALDSVPGKLGNQGELSPAQMAMNDIESFDCRFVENEFDTNIIPKLENLGFPKLGNYKLRFGNNAEKASARKKEDENNKVTVDIVKVLVDAGFKPDAKYITERTGIPVSEVIEPVKIDKKANIARMEAIENKLKSIYHTDCNHD